VDCKDNLDTLEREHMPLPGIELQFLRCPSYSLVSLQTRAKIERLAGSCLTFKNRASYIWDGRTATLKTLHFIYIFSTNTSTEYFKHAAHSPFFSSKCRLFRNDTFFGSCIIHILRTGCAKI